MLIKIAIAPWLSNFFNRPSHSKMNIAEEKIVEIIVSLAAHTAFAEKANPEITNAAATKQHMTEVKPRMVFFSIYFDKTQELSGHSMPGRSSKIRLLWAK